MISPSKLWTHWAQKKSWSTWHLQYPATGGPLEWAAHFFPRPQTWSPPSQQGSDICGEGDCSGWDNHTCTLYRDICSSAPQENADLGLPDPQSPQNPQVQMWKHLGYLTPFWKTCMNPMRPIPQSASSRPPSYRFPFCRAYTQTLVHSGLKDHTQHRFPWKNPLVYLIKQK